MPNRVTKRDRALALAVKIIEARAVEIERDYFSWREKHPSDTLGPIKDQSAHLECELLARLIREKMSPAGRAALQSVTKP